MILIIFLAGLIFIGSASAVDIEISSINNTQLNNGVDGIIIDSTNIGANSYDNEISILSDSNADWDSYLRPSDQDTRYWRINTTLICGNDKYYLEYWWEPSENGNSTKCTIECIQKGSSYNWESYFVSVDNNKTRIVSPFFDDNILNNLNEGQSITFSTNIPLGLAIGNYRFYITANDKEVYSKDFIAKPRNINFDEDLRPYHTNFYFKQSLIKEGDILTVEGYLISGLIESKSTINGLITVILNNNISKTVKIEFTNYQYAYVNVNFENLAPGNYSITKVIFNESDCYWYYYEGIPFSNNVSVVLDRSECYVSANGVDDWKTGGTKDHPFATLDYALDYVNENGKIILIGENSLQNFAINKSVTLVGIDNAVFRGDNSYRFFNISASNVTFSNLTFINGKVNNEGYGGALYFGANASNSAVIGCTFINSSAYNGGAIYLYNATGATIKDCNFINSTAKYSNNGYGGAICLDFGTGVNITNCSFINSFAGYYGGAIYYYEINDCNVIDCNFINSSSKAGGAIYCSNSINNSNVINCNFTNCNTTLQGGAIYCGGINGSVIGCTFINSSSEDGGAITWASSDGHVMGCSFINCSASDGGVISIYANLVLNYNIFDNNSPINGSVIYSKYNNTNCDYNFFALENNITELPDNLVTGTTVDNWVILKINALNGNYYVNFVSNDNNTLEEFMPDYTALLNINGAVKNITIKNNTFNDNFIEGNYLLTSLNSGNVLANNTFNIPEDSFSQLAYEIDHLEGNELVLTHNYTYYTEYDEDYNNGITIDKSIIIDGQGYTINGFNLASIFKVNANVTIKNIKFINGTGSILGGAIYLTDEAINASVSGCSFDNCYALSGGAIFCENVDCSVSNCSFNNCSAMFGGAICCLSANGSVCDCNFTDCYAWFGGAIHWSEEDTNAILTDCCFVNCYALSGGAIYSINVNGYVDDCTFVNCSANNNNFDLDDEDYDCWGGAIFWYGEYLAVNSCNFTYCTAEDIGSAIYTLSSLNITNSTSTAVVGDDKAPIYNEGTILSDVVITTMGGEDKYVIYGDTVNLTATVTTSGIAIAGGELKFTINSQEFTIESDNEGIYSVPYTVDFYGTKSVNADYLNCDGNQIVNKYNITVGVPHKLKTYIVSDYNGENVFEGKYGEQLTLNFIVYDENGGLVNSGNLTLWFNGKAYSATVENGYVTITDESLVLNSTGLYSYVIDYSNSNNLYANSFNFTNINIPKVTTQISIDKNVTGDTVSTGKVTLMINVTDVEAKVNVNKGFIYYVSPDGIGHTVNVTNGSVEVVIDVNRTGEYDIAVSYYDLDDDFLYSSADFTWNIQFTTTLISVNSVEDNLIATVRVVDDLGNNAKGNLDLFINGKKLELTILNGFATFNLVEFSDSVEISAIFTGEDGLISYDNVVIELVKTPENSYNSYESLESDLVNDTGDVDKTKVVDDTDDVDKTKVVDDNSTSEDNKSKTAVVAGIPMQNTAIPIIALILALLTLPLVYRRKL